MRNDFNSGKVMSISTKEKAWDSQSDSLNRLRRDLQDSSQRNYQPLDDNHPLLRRDTPQNPRRDTPTRSQSLGTPTRHNKPLNGQVNGGFGTTTPTRSLPRLETPPDHRHKTPVRGVRFNVLPDVSKHNGKTNGYDSWGEEGESEEEEDDRAYPATYPLPYQLVMYPMVVPNAAYSRGGGNRKKRVQMRDTPVYLNSREHTLHEPQAIHAREYNLDPYESGDAQLPYISAAYDPFDPRMNPVLAQYQMPMLDPRSMRGRPSHKRSNRSKFGFSASNTDLLEDILTGVVEDVVADSSEEVVREIVREMAGQHLERAAVFDIAVELVLEEMSEQVPDLVLECMDEVLLEDIVYEEFIDPEVQEQSGDIVKEMFLHYGNKRRQRDIRELQKLISDHLLDSMCLDYLLLHMNCESDLDTKEEHVQRLLESLVLDVLLDKLDDVERERSFTINNKPIRRYHEHLVADMMGNFVLEELCQTLDEDMCDLDEYEQGLDHAQYQKFGALRDLAKSL